MHRPLQRRTFVFSGLVPFTGALFGLRNTFAMTQKPAERKNPYANHCPVSDPPLWKRYSQGDLKGNISAKRPLNLKDLNLLLQLSDYLIDKTNPWVERDNAAHDLGLLGHKYAIPALMAVARDESDIYVRARSVIALSMTRDKRVVDYLIDEALGMKPILDHQALAGLVFLVGKPPELIDHSYAGSVKHPPEDPKKRAQYLNIWRKWWKKNRDQIKLGRGGGLISY